MPSAPRWEQRFLGTTRGQVILLLRRARRTVDELAAHLGLTDNAVRSHLATLERDGLVSQAGQRRGEGGKPATFYALTPEAEHLFPKAYGLILREVLDVLGTRLSASEVEAVLRDVGRRLAAGYAIGSAMAGPAERVQRAVQVLDALGGLAAAEPDPPKPARADAARADPATVTIYGYACPLAEVLPDHPAVCRLAETLLSDVTGLPVVEACERHAAASHCRFVVHLDAEPAR